MTMKQFAYACMGGIWVFILAVYLAFNGGCARAALHVRTPDQQQSQAVRIVATCPGGGMGSGVIVGPTTVVTAYHVVACDVPSALDMISVVTEDGAERTATLANVSVDGDVAVLTLLVGEPFDVVSVDIGPFPEPGTRVCGAYATPDRTRTCGEVQREMKPPTFGIGHGLSLSGNIKHTATTRPGNSGGGLYDSEGRLVGVVTHLWYCTDILQICGGRATALWKYRGMLGGPLEAPEEL